MNVKIWDNYNKQWLEPMMICFRRDGVVSKVSACVVGADPISDGWFDIQGEDLRQIAITGEVSFNAYLLPPPDITDKEYRKLMKALYPKNKKR